MAALEAILITGTTTSCKKDMFKQDVYDSIMKQEFPIDPVDAAHSWNLTTRRTATVNITDTDIRRIMVLTDDPATNYQAAIMAQKTTFNRGDNFLTFAAPTVQTTFYAAVEQNDGSLLVKPFTTSDARVTMADATQEQKPVTAPGYQTFTYCFEEDYPQPGDYDFNDCVLRISVTPGDQPNQRKINVSVAATGANKLIAAALRLVNYNYDDIESVTTTDGKRWDEDYPTTQYILTNTETLQQGRNGEAAIRLFENASWIMVHNQPDNVGMLTNYKVNVTKTTTETTKQINPPVKTYIVTFKESATALLDNFTLLNIDPFIVTNFNGGNWETHVYEHKHANVLFEGVRQESGHMTWAICVPDGNFRWPLEGLIIGTKKDGLLTGVYREFGHSFGEWAANRNTAKDWYLYPTIADVY